MALLVLTAICVAVWLYCSPSARLVLNHATPFLDDVWDPEESQAELKRHILANPDFHELGDNWESFKAKIESRKKD